MGYSYTYTYDNAGNIVSKSRYSFTTGTLGSANYTYGYSYGDTSWGDLLTGYNNNTIAYDEIGNPIKIGYYDESMDIWWYGTELTWDGRELVSYRWFEYYHETFTSYGTPITFTYNDEGIRTSKTIDGIKHEYILSGSEIVGETWTQNGVEYLLLYVYDEAGSPIAIKYRTSNYAEGAYDVYFLEKNLQGDIVAVYNSSGTKIGSYTYDAWGNFNISYNSTATLDRLIVSTYNPFRYRGYYYDTATSLYYLQSRYYNAQWGRFISADGFDVLTATPYQLTDKNIFAYCDNNPVMRADADGEFWLTSILVGAAIGAVVEATISIVDQLIFEGEIDWEDVAADALTGALTGAVATVMPASAFGVTISLNAIISGVSSIYMDIKENNEAITENRPGDVIGVGEIAVDSIVSAGFSALFTYIGGPSDSGCSRKFAKIMLKAAKDLGSSMFSGSAEWLCGTLTSGVTNSYITYNPN